MKSIRNVLEKRDPERYSSIKEQLEGMSDSQIIDGLTSDYQEIDETIVDHIGIQKGSVSMRPGFTKGLKFYLVNHLHQADKRKELDADIDAFSQIEALRPLMKSIETHLAQYDENENTLSGRPYKEAAATSILSKGDKSKILPADASSLVGSFFDKRTGLRAGGTTKAGAENARHAQHEAENKMNIQQKPTPFKK